MNTANNIEQYCPNPIFNNGTISIGEFKTIEEAMNFPLKQVWCINRDEDNKFQAYKNQGTRILIICDWKKSIQDAKKFVLALVFGGGEIKYFDLNDIPLDTKQCQLPTTKAGIIMKDITNTTAMN